MADYDPACSEIQDPPLHLAIQGRRWMGGEFEAVRNAVELDLHSTDTEGDAREILLALRRIVLQRFEMALAACALVRSDLDFDAPNQPTEDDVSDLVSHVERLLVAAKALRELAPEVIEPDATEDADA